jgi:hypothetical protein
MDQVALHDDKAPVARDVNIDDWAIRKPSADACRSSKKRFGVPRVLVSLLNRLESSPPNLLNEAYVIGD